MSAERFAEIMGDDLASALATKGYTTLTPIQTAVLETDVSGFDLRIISQTGSGKTLAIGFTLRDSFEKRTGKSDGNAHPQAIVLTPTRELAKQVASELQWLFAPAKVRIACVTGGSGFSAEFRSFKDGPDIVVGTPGRVVDHLNRGSLLLDRTKTVVLDEADRMLDMGFREDLDAVFDKAPKERRTHLVSATFAHDVLRLAQKVQTRVKELRAQTAGAAHEDIEHRVYLAREDQIFDALVNLLLFEPNAKTLIFAKTRMEVAHLTEKLSSAGFPVVSLSGEMEQRDRNRSLQSFKRGSVHTLVATDVAARGLDVPDISRVIQLNPPRDSETYVHRSGRTGRAGQKGISVLLITPDWARRVNQLLKGSGLKFDVHAVPSEAEVRAKQEASVYEELTKTDIAPDLIEDAGVLPDGDDEDTTPMIRLEAGVKPSALALRLIARDDIATVVDRLIQRGGVYGPCLPRRVDKVAMKTAFVETGRGRTASGSDRFRRDGDAGFSPRARGPYAAAAPRGARSESSGERRGPPSGDFVSFDVTWGAMHGAEARRLIAMLCRRGDIEGRQVGRVDVGPTSSRVEVAASVADKFQTNASKPDPRDPRVRVFRSTGPGPAEGPGERPRYVGPQRSGENGASERRGPPPRDDRRPPSRDARSDDRRPPARSESSSGSRGETASGSRPFTRDTREPTKPTTRERRPPPSEGAAKFAPKGRGFAPLKRPPRKDEAPRSRPKR